VDCLIVASTEPYAGKTGVTAALLLEAAERGVIAGYFKPFGTMPVSAGDHETDSDAAYLSSLAALKAPSELVCPVVRTHALVERVLAGEATPVVDKVLEAYRTISADVQVVFVEGPSDLSQGTVFGLDLQRLAAMLCGRVLLLHRPGTSELPEEVVHASDILGDSLLGVLINDVPYARLEATRTRVATYLEREGIRVLGVLGHDASLSAVSVAEIVASLDGVVLAGEAGLEEPVESFMVGAMGQEKALRYFRRRARKAVVTGGDRSDVQLAALETDTRCVICTGGMAPSSIVLSRADELGIPMVLVEMDTLSAVEHMEVLFGHVRVHDAVKVARIRELLAEQADLDALFSALGGA